ncbi:uncharacterized protein [Oscarella lobularis]|uniref:uncharacterized protein n=1 Tax=Oscarella lobularis TaxID=121494 RepID=UPI0033138C96
MTTTAGGGSGGIPFNRLPYQPKGRDFLAASHFRVGNDSRFTTSPTAMRSTFTIDYPPRDPRLSHRSAVPAPEPADLMHADKRTQQRGNENNSETTTSFRKHDVHQPKFKSVSSGYETNFRMHADPSIVGAGFRTTHDVYFPSRDLAAARQPVDEALSTMRSYVPEGDKAKEKTNRSEYGRSFRGERAPPATPSQSWSTGTNAIRGDPRSLNGWCVTTAAKAYNGWAYPDFRPPSPIRPVPPMHVSSIPQGDRLKADQPSSVQQDSYRRHANGEATEPYDKSDAVARVGATTFRLGTSLHGDMRSTTGETYSAPKEAGRQAQIAPSYRNVSSFPEGDVDPSRVASRINNTTTKAFHQRYGSDHYQVQHVIGANLRTHSNVHFGKPEFSSYGTSTGSTYSARQTGNRHVVKASPTTSIPINLGYEFGQSTSRTSYRNHANRLRYSDPVTADNLRRSHWKPEKISEAIFSTEHTDQFTPKPNQTREKIDTFRLQRSSLPLGSSGRLGNN